VDSSHLWMNCSQPAAPAPDDGCETNGYGNYQNCGACGFACGVNGAGAVCQCPSVTGCYCGC
jgi:hypothetical protein